MKKTFKSEIQEIQFNNYSRIILTELQIATWEIISP